MDAKLQRRVQRYGWDKAAPDYERYWQAQLLPPQDCLMQMAALQPGESVLDIACGTGLITFRAAEAIGSSGSMVATDISQKMVDLATELAAARGVDYIRFERCDGEDLPLDADTFDAALCGLGMMYMPDPAACSREMLRVLKPGGRAVSAVWGQRNRCGWAELFPIVDRRVSSEVCPMFFFLGTQDMLARTFQTAGFVDVETERITTELVFDTEADALGAAFIGGPVAMAYAHFDDDTRAEAHTEYLDSIAAYRDGDGYRVPGEFVIVSGRKAD